MNLLQDFSVEKLQRCVNVRVVAMSIVALVIGVAVVFYAIGLADSMLSSLGLLVGCVAILVSLYYVCFHATHWVYPATGSEVKKSSLHCEAKKFFEMWEDASEKFGFKALNCYAEQSEIRMDCIYSKDGKFAALQLFQYSSLLYTPVTEVYELTGDKASQWIAYYIELNK